MTELYIGLMSGTSMDAVDAALVELSAATPHLVAAHSHPLPESLRQPLLSLCRPGGTDELHQTARLDVAVGRLFADAADALLRKAGVETAAVRAIGSHGQTLRHQPTGELPYTVQIGDPNTLAERTGITTVADFRRRDLAAGGQGAPLVPAFHAAALMEAGEDRVVLNIGGMANLTHLPGTRDTAVSGFDTGPGNVLLDGWCQRMRGEAFDRGGDWAASGRVDEKLLATLLAEDYFGRAPPKSTGREDFNLEWLDTALNGREINAADVQATLAELTARSVATAVHNTCPACARAIVCGGGAHNGDLLTRLAARLPGVRVETTARHGIDPDWVEAMAFAWLARETLAGRPGNVPAVTGACRPVVLGGIYPGR